MTNSNTKLAEWAYAVVFAVVMVVVMNLHLGRLARIFTLLGVSVFGFAAYIYLFRARFHGRRLKVGIAAIVGTFLGGVIMFLLFA